MIRRLTLLVLFCVWSASANPWNGKVVLQAFWWNYWNNNYPNDWATYLADLAPRLREMGIDAVWIPPTIKNKNATGSVGYAPFDQYDLGDKYQCGSVATRFGTKDQYLRAVAILHANGIEVIQDVVWNHMDGAGTETGAGGLDPVAPSNQYKNFRNVCYATPGTSTDAANYGARSGRFPKNWENFHPNPDHNTENDDITTGIFGPDICYYSNARGLSSNCSYNPTQSTDYMRNGMRNWSVWMKKQTGVDGFRIDAAKHFETWVTQDFLWNLAFNAGFASGGNQMYAVGEFIGSSAQMDAWVDAANSANGGTVDLVGTFDFNLRGALKAVVDGNGFYDLGSLPGAQQNRRSRTAAFVNNHDTFRPTFDASGRYTGWDSGQEIGGHIDPSDVRAPIVYAVAMAVDGSPNIYFEDLFDLNTGKRWTHSPTNTVDLPTRSWLTNQIWCHQKLNFKDGAYKVRWQAADLLIIERSAHAIIAVNDNAVMTQGATVQTDFGANVLLHDYSGANANDARTDTTGHLTFSVPPCDGSNLHRGYAIWGPAGISGGFAPTVDSVTQEWEMADDLGDSHPSSLRQGGALPANSTATRTVGKIYPAAGSTVIIDGFATLSSANWKITALDSTSTEVASVTGINNFRLTFIPTRASYYTIRVQNAAATNPSQTVWVKADYTAPRNRFSTGPVFSKQPSNSYIVAGDTALLSAQVTASPAAVFQWTKDGSDIAGATESTYSAEAAGSYSVRVWNEAALVTSAAATVTIYSDAQPSVSNLNYSAADGFGFDLTERTGLRYQIESTADFINWSTEQTATAPFAFHAMPTDAARFYRIVYIP